MVALDILAPIFLMLGIRIVSSANASLLGNFEIVATTLIALLLFKEKVSGKLWISILFITVSSIILSFEGSGSFQFSMGSLFVLLATVCCETGSFLIATIIGESLPKITHIALAMILGFAAYGLSIFLYIKAQRNLGLFFMIIGTLFVVADTLMYRHMTR